MSEFAVVKFSAEEMQSRIEDFPSKNEETDENECPDFGICYPICIVFSMITYILDVTVHCWLSYLYYAYGQLANCILTIIFIILPALVTTAFSLRWYIIDVDEPSISRPPIWKWIVRVIVLLLQIAPVLRYFDTLVYGIRSKRARCNEDMLHVDGYYRKMLDEDSNAASLRLFHCFLFAGMQAVIQLSAVISARKQRITHSTLEDYQLMGVICSLVSIAWSIATYHRSVRYARDDKGNVSWFGTALLFLWHISISASRVMALSLIASLYPTWTICMCVLHWLVMSVWLALSNLHTTLCGCGSWCEEVALTLMLGFAYILTYIPPRDGQTRYTYLTYYLVCFIENVGILVIIWFFDISSVATVNDQDLYYRVISSQVGTFILGIIFMLIYYRWFHPTSGMSRFHFDIVQKPRRVKWIGVISD